MGLWHTAPGLGFDVVNQSPATYYTYREEGRVFTDVGMWDDTQVSVTGLDKPEKVDAVRVTDGTLPILGVLRQGLLLTAAGVAVGVAAAAGLTRLMSALLFGVSSTDPLTYAGVAVGLALVALPASWVPARRAASVDPIEALRAE